ncbi:transcription elongation regulator 1 [Pseudohyphozyma bogoriensis]|nr:transcription elongation regulator 1 [Pseudohyphozyma bogoriensis]
MPQAFGPPMHFPPAPPAPAPAPAPVKEKKEKKEKPKEKIPIEGTDWTKVITNKGNVFWTNSETKESLWEVPEAIKEVVEALEKEEKEKEKVAAAAAASAAAASAAAASAKREREEEEAAKQEEEGKTEYPAPNKDGEIIYEPKKKKQKKKVIDDIEELEADEEWQQQQQERREAEEAELERKRMVGAAGEDGRVVPPPREDGGDGGEEVKEKPAVMQMELTKEEGAAVFKAMLSGLEINPMAPWELELPKFVHDPRYAAVKLLKDRRDLFDEYCKEKLREIRAAKKAAMDAGKIVKVDPLTAYRELLSSTVTSTRTHFSDFKRANAKDSRFRDFGKTEGEKEKVFKQYLRELGEKKRVEAEKAEERFKEMLRGDEKIRSGDKWADVKGRHVEDPRYAGVNSSSLRESLFNAFVKSLGSSSGGDSAAAPLSRAEKAAKAVREREEQVRAEKEKVARSANAARGALGREEGEREWRTLLIDVVRDHEARWDATIPLLEKDPRFINSPLNPHEQRRLFDSHLNDLYTKRINAVESLFLSHAPLLNTPFTEVLPSIDSNPHITRLVGTDFDRLEGLYTSWQKKRFSKARAEFDELLKESPIIQHWGRMKVEAEEARKREEEGENGMSAGKAEDEDDDEGELGTKELAKQIDLKAIHAVLKHDKRYLIFDHMPDERDEWTKDFVDHLAKPKMTAHQRD